MSDRTKVEEDDEEARKARAKRLHEQIHALIKRDKKRAPSSPRDFVNEKTRKRGPGPQ